MESVPFSTLLFILDAVVLLFFYSRSLTFRCFCFEKMLVHARILLKSPVFYFRSGMGVVQHRHFYLHEVFGGAQKYGGTHKQSEAPETG